MVPGARPEAALGNKNLFLEQPTTLVLLLVPISRLLFARTPDHLPLKSASWLLTSLPGLGTILSVPILLLTLVSALTLVPQALLQVSGPASSPGLVGTGTHHRI